MTGDMASQRDLSGCRRFGSGAVSFVGRHPVGSYLVLAFAIFWASRMPVLFFGAPPRPFSAVGAIFGLAVPVFLMMCARRGPSPDRAGALAYAFAHVDLPEMDAESHAGESLTGDLMTEAW